MLTHNIKLSNGDTIEVYRDSKEEICLSSLPLSLPVGDEARVYLSVKELHELIGVLLKYQSDLKKEESK